MDALPSTPAMHPPPPSPQKVWPRASQGTTALLLCVTGGLLGFNAFQASRWGARPTTLHASAGLAYRIDLNRADRAELLQIPGVGPALAERIEAHRREHGLFQRVDDLRGVHGIGPATLERIRPWVCVESEAEEESEPKTATTRIAYYSGNDQTHEPTSTAASKKKPGDGSVRIELNRASAAELQQLPGIGPKISQRILDERAKRPFTSVEELRRVPGIGAKTLDKLRSFIAVESPAPAPPRGVAAEEH